VSTREEFILEISVLIFLGVLALLGLTLLILRRLHARPLPGNADSILEAIEGVRQQQSAEHSAMQAEQRSQGNLLRRLMNRFGFLREGGE
jgi:type VI protein secretion system component VasK